MIKYLGFPVYSTLWSHGPEFPHDLVGASLTRGSVCVCARCVFVYIACCKQGCKQCRASKDREKAREHNFRKFTTCWKRHRINTSHQQSHGYTQHTIDLKAKLCVHIILLNRCSVLEFSPFPSPPSSLSSLPEMSFFKAARLQRHRANVDTGRQNRFHFKLIPADGGLGLDTTTLVLNKPVSVRN